MGQREAYRPLSWSLNVSTFPMKVYGDYFSAHLHCTVLLNHQNVHCMAMSFRCSHKLSVFYRILKPFKISHVEGLMLLKSVSAQSPHGRGIKVGRVGDCSVLNLLHCLLFSIILQAASLLLYPLVLGSPIAKVHCGSQTNVYDPAGCRIGWAYIAAITSTILACYCPLLGHFSHYNVFSPGLWTEI
ncbi:uncharacterized protein TNCV_3587251 [Trichonephila clavipes]|nr:uncharacterized protein TNCV_3587251 [Trichonephila clavipes]